jgi:hypothetical protein
MGVRVGLLHLLQRRLVVERGELLGQPLQDVTYGNRKFHLIMMIRLVREGRELEVERGIRGATCCSSLIVIVPPLFASHFGTCDNSGLGRHSEDDHLLPERRFSHVILVHGCEERRMKMTKATRQTQAVLPPNHKPRTFRERLLGSVELGVH